VLRYGPRAEHIADLRLPEPGPHRQRRGQLPPMVIFLHGGFWRVAYDRAHTGPLAAALAAAGFAVCTPEYRRTGQTGGGWPGTLDDVAAAVDILPGRAAEATRGLIDPGRILLAGHSAGGHLALWAGGGTGCRPASAGRCSGVQRGLRRGPWRGLRGGQWRGLRGGQWWLAWWG
jgi:acetyl esterase/lipase